MTPINAVIITKEKDTLQIIKKFEKENFMILKIVNETTSIIEGITNIQLHKPDLVLLDISFKDDTFFDMLNELEMSIPKLVFISANKQDAVKAFKQNAIDFILKPVDFNSLILAVYKTIKRTKMERSYQNQKIKAIELLNSLNQPNDYVAVSSLDKIELITKAEIIYCQAEGRYTTFFLRNGKKIMSSKNLGEYSAILDPNYFFRIHHSYIINLRHLVKISKKEGYFCEFPNGVLLAVAKRRQEDFNKFIKLKE
ncbi:LytR/AlgR family response regulator transcription factor [Flavobacterium algoritolerans]|jgi:two-component system LytT family response regulator|uniref:LytTR family DNA-binding domain-containing protein n=1 Tax=Flavobacterium algoritolerans TaxID=3041254 RepID=A0ABT6VFL9_9FLAO|nr:LytTR family DNA-binding domain-containing protein [Flavobacterium algoritolerans]MDI5895777.1 LytTR family DNA-binding domain-containing protein [Flavobacterium algoritolerans]